MGVGAGWYYDSKDNDVVHQNYTESLANALPGFSYFHGPYATEAEAIAHKGVPDATPPRLTAKPLALAAGDHLCPRRLPAMGEEPRMLFPKKISGVNVRPTSCGCQEVNTTYCYFSI